MTVTVAGTVTIPAKYQPKNLLTDLEYKINRYCVYEDGIWSCYFAKVGAVEEGARYIPFLSAPPIGKSGYFAFKKKFYPVSLRDLVRSHINVNPQYGLTLSQLNQRLGLTTQEPAPSPGLPNQQPSIRESTGQESQLIDVAWDEQVRTLLLLEDPEEEWGF